MNNLVESARMLTTAIKEVYRDDSGKNNNELAHGMQGCMKANGPSTSKDHERDRKMDEGHQEAEAVVSRDELSKNEEWFGQKTAVATRRVIKMTKTGC